MQTKIIILCAHLAASLFAGCNKSDEPANKKEKASIGGGGGTKPPSNTCLKVINGQETKKYPAVVFLGQFTPEGQIKLGCTGTFVGNNVLITAMHCVPAAGSGQDLYYVPGAPVVLGKDLGTRKALLAKSKKASTVIEGEFAANGGMISAKDAYKDLAILIFDSAVAPGVTPILERGAKIGDKVAVVGFGSTSAPSANDSPSAESTVPKRFGVNSLKKLTGFPDNKDVLVIFGRGETTQTDGTATDSSVGHGDSGGPLIIESALAGVASAGGLLKELYPSFTPPNADIEAFAGYADINSTYAKGLIEKAKAKGAKFGAAATASETPEEDPCE